MSDERRTRRYESMIVLRTDLLEAGVKEQAERVRKLLETHGAVVAGIHDWGLRELAYAIQKERRGYYLLAEYTGPAAAVAELERTLKLSDVVLRFVSIRQDEDSPPVVPPQREAESAANLDDTLQSDDELAPVGAEAGDVE
ncbi:MAG: 30S ribosomal protein S6 [Deltaproteobacteria bacterium]|nr:30S ribosomal protein S6 [Deltaproteobacteria bacterium]